MKKRLHFSIILLLIFTITTNYSCNSSKKALEKGDYYSSCLLAIKKLRTSPNNTKASESLQQAYPLLLQTTQININNTVTLNTPNKYRTVYNEYLKLNNVYQNILTCPAALKIIPSPQSFINEQNQAQENAFVETMKNADNKLSEGSHASAKKAYFIYGEALKLDPTNSLVKEKQADALDKATIKVVLEQIPVVRPYNLSSSFFYDQLFTTLNSDIRNQFIVFYRPEEAESMQLVPDHIITMSFDNFIIGQQTDKKTISDVTKDSVIVGSIEMPDKSKQDVYNTVKAKLTTTTRTIESRGVLSIHITDFATNQLLSHERFEGLYIWETAWGKFKGDSRALTKKELNICDKEIILPPSDQDLFLEFTKPIFKNSSNFIIQFYRNF